MVFKKKNKTKLPVMQEMQVQFLGCKDLLEKEMTTRTNILAWETQTEEPGRLQSLKLLPIEEIIPKHLNRVF